MRVRSDEKTAEKGRTLRDITLKRRYVREKHSRERLAGCGPGDIKNVLVIQSASRSGSSFLYRLLSGHPDIISLNGEDIVFHKLAGIGRVNSETDSDFLPSDFNPGPAVLERVAEDILLDSGCVYSGQGPFPSQNYAADCVQRLMLQWPAADPDRLYDCASAALEEGRSRNSGFDAQRVWASFLALLGRRGIAVNPWRYDLEPEIIRRLFPGIKPPSGPPPDCGLEDPPFVVPEPRIFPGADEIGRKTLLLKSSSNCYRAGFIKKLFPSAGFRFALLFRNPMAAVNGLMDGWLSSGFFSHDLGKITGLDIKGYSAASKSWTRRWWKFDLPPGWAGYAGKTLEEVCAFQWLSANEHILKNSDNGVFGEKVGVKYEDLLAPSYLARELKKILDFAGLKGCDITAAAAARPVMAVSAPRPGKWLRRRRLLLPLCSEKVKAVAARLGYDPREPEKWK